MSHCYVFGVFFLPLIIEKSSLKAKYDYAKMQQKHSLWFPIKGLFVLLVDIKIGATVCQAT